MSRTNIFWLVVLAIVISPGHLLDPSCKGTYNTHEIYRDEPTFVTSVTNGKRFVVGQGYDKINIAHVYGNTPYDMGVAFGKLMKQELNAVIPEYFAYLDKTVEDMLKKLPPVSLKKFEWSRFISFWCFSSIVSCQMDC